MAAAMSETGHRRRQGISGEALREPRRSSRVLLTSAKARRWDVSNEYPADDRAGPDSTI
jgi:hypothetical protein